LAVKWLVDEPDSPIANRLHLQLAAQGIDRLMPRWALLEVSNAILQKVARGHLALGDATIHLSELPRFVTLVDSTLDHSKRALTIAHQLGLPAVYDAHFLVLAEELGCELWTADERFWRTVVGQFPFVRWLGDDRVATEPETQ
jgi:predicted nucleic acid-binding protein